MTTNLLNTNIASECVSSIKGQEERSRLHCCLYCSDGLLFGGERGRGFDQCPRCTRTLHSFNFTDANNIKFNNQANYHTPFSIVLVIINVSGCVSVDSPNERAPVAETPSVLKKGSRMGTR